jgi:hypothetical protein
MSKHTVCAGNKIKQIQGLTLQIEYMNVGVYMRTALKLSDHFYYLENRSNDLNVTWQPVRGDLTVHP